MLLVIIYFTFAFIYDRPRVIFCDVGEGDAIYIRTMAKNDILIDAGRNTKVLECLSRHMPFYDRTIEIAFLTHPDLDHSGGYTEVLKRYTVSTFVKNVSAKEQIFPHTLSLFQGDSLTLHNSHFDVIWPPQEFIEKKRYKTTNEISQVMIFEEGGLRILFTGDIDPGSTGDLLNTCITCYELYNNVSVLKVPHHGAANGLTSQLLKAIHPQLSIISVGKNSYGHPSKAVLELFQGLHMDYLRTDQKGDLVIRYDEHRWWVEK